MIPSPITNLSEFITQLKELVRDIDSTEFEIFFRGHMDKEFRMIPSLLRTSSRAKGAEGTPNPDTVRNEHIAFRNIIVRQSSEFIQCSSAIEYLVKMQHYGLKTRLLDITSNALIALYFACVEHGKANNKAGEVVILKLPKNIIKHYDSDTISALANIAKCTPSAFHFPLCGDLCNPGAFIKGLGNDTKSQTYKRYTVLSIIPHIEGLRGEINSTKGPLSKRKEEFKSRIKMITDILKGLELSDSINSAINNCTSDPFSKKKDSCTRLDSLIGEIKKYSASGNNLRNSIQESIRTSNDLDLGNNYIDWFNRNLGFLHHQIKAEKPYYAPQIAPYDLGKIWAVNVKLDNKRIINQRGAFLIFGLGIDEIQIDETTQLSYTKNIYPKFPEEWVAGRITIGDKDETNNSIKSQKEDIIEELRLLGIEHSFIFPDLENVAKEINSTLLQ